MMLTLQAAAAALRLGRLSPVDLLERCLDRIERLDGQVRAWVFVDHEAARAEAKQAADELARGQRRGPLHGVPLGVKDIFDVFDWPTAAGSRLWAQSYARRDATVVERLRRAGAVLIGKTVTTQWASFDPPPTVNPWDPKRTPGGSSSGSAAAVACGMALGALGSQTGGSITRPAAYCGVFGCKPTYARVSSAGVVPLAPSMDHPGVFARSVHDLAVLLQTIAGPDPLDPTAAERPVPDYLSALSGNLPTPRLARLRGLFDDLAEPPALAMMDQAVADLRSRGAIVLDLAPPSGFVEVLSCHRTVMAVEAAVYHAARLRRHPEDYEPRIRSLLEEGLGCPATEYARCKEHQRRLARDMLVCFDGVDALVTPATTGPAPSAETTGNPAFNAPWSYTGLPTVSVPFALTANGLPLSVQLVGRPWDEAGLFRVAAWCERELEADLGEPPVCRDESQG